MYYYLLHDKIIYEFNSPEWDMRLVRQTASFLVAALLSLTLMSCSSSSSTTSSTTLSGTAATGAPIAGFVYVKDATGTEVNVATGTNGSFTLDVTGMTAPFMVRVIPDNGDPTLYSYASAAGQTVNVTPLTNLTMFIANGSADLGALYGAWDGSGVTSAAVVAAQKTVNANLLSEFTAAGIDGASYDFMTTAFTADGSGFDAVLDALQVAVDNTAGSFTLADSASTPITFDSAIDVTGISIAVSTSTTTTISGGSGGTLPDGVASEAVTMEYCCAAATGSPYSNGAQVLFTFSSSGTLLLTDQFDIVSETFEVVGSEYVWTDATTSIKYALSLSNGAINEVNLNSASGTFLGQFAPVTTGGSTTSGGSNSLAITGSSDVASPFTPLDKNVNTDSSTFASIEWKVDAGDSSIAVKVNYADAVSAPVITVVKSTVISTFSVSTITWTAQGSSSAPTGLAHDPDTKTYTFTNVQADPEGTNPDSLMLNGSLTYTGTVAAVFIANE